MDRSSLPEERPERTKDVLQARANKIPGKANPFFADITDQLQGRHKLSCGCNYYLILETFGCRDKVSGKTSTVY